MPNRRRRRASAGRPLHRSSVTSKAAELEVAGAIKQAEAEAKEIVSEASTEAEEERNRILSELRTQVASIAIAATNKLVQEELNEERQRRLVSSFLADPPQGVDELSGTEAVVTSALPLTDDEKSRLQSVLSVENVDFRVNPAILGGLIVRVGDQVVDDSVARQMGAMRESLV